MSDQETSEADASVRWLLVGFVAAMILAIGLAALFYQPQGTESICSNTEARCGDKPDPSMQ
ncbi:MAG TPA: hypothetical protein VEV64_09405 [Rhizomicrobium sp.]|nr:hypothetical protein [Rhizomicrobium sp.]